MEFFHSTDHVQQLAQRYHLRRGAEIARIVMIPDVPAGYRYYTNLGFGCSETIEDDRTLYAALGWSG